MTAADRIAATIDANFLTSKQWCDFNNVDYDTFRALCRGKLKPHLLREGPYIFVDRSVRVKVLTKSYGNRKFLVSKGENLRESVQS